MKFLLVGGCAFKLTWAASGDHVLPGTFRGHLFLRNQKVGLHDLLPKIFLDCLRGKVGRQTQLLCLAGSEG